MTKLYLSLSQVEKVCIGDFVKVWIVKTVVCSLFFLLHLKNEFVQDIQSVLCCHCTCR